MLDPCFEGTCPPVNVVKCCSLAVTVNNWVLKATTKTVVNFFQEKSASPEKILRAPTTKAMMKLMIPVYAGEL